MVLIPLPETPRPHENIQALLDEYFKTKLEFSREYLECSNVECNKRVAKNTKIELVDAKSAIVVDLNRERPNPKWSEAGFKDLPLEEQAKYPGTMDVRDINLSHIIKIPTVAGVAYYDLVATIEHIGTVINLIYV